MKLTSYRQAPLNQKEAVGEPPARIVTPGLLEQALAAGDENEVKKHLREGADPGRVSAELLSAVGQTPDVAKCVRLIQVAARLQHMGITKQYGTPIEHRSASQASGKAAAPKARLIGRFALGFTKKSSPVLDTPITKALLEHDLPAANAALTQSPTPELVFLKRNIDHLNGVLALDDQVRLESLHRTGMLDSALSSVESTGTREMLKKFSYASRKPGRNPRVTFNNAVKFRGSEQMIECRHLAMHWLMDRPVGKDGKRDYTKLSSAKKVQTALKNQTDATFTSFKNTCHEAHLVDINMFGGLLATQFADLAKAGSGAPPRRLLILSDNHAMACELKVKHDENGQLIYAVSFYDPNLTATHRRVRMSDLRSIEALSMHDLINDSRRVSEYYKGQSLTMVMVVPNEVPGTGRSSSKQMFAEATTGNRRLTSSAGRLDGGAPTANYLFQLLDNNFTGELPQAFKRIDAIADAEQQVAILAAVNSQGAPALAKLFLEGDKHTQAVSMFTTAVLASEVLSSKQKTELLMARLPEPFAIRGFLAALGGGQTKVLTTFMQLVLHSPALSPEEKYRLLEMKATHDTDFLKDAIADGLGNTVIAYKEALARSPLSQQMISDMQTHG